MTGLSSITDFLEKYISFESIPRMVITDYIEILLISFLVYSVLVWIKNSKAWSLLRGIIVIGLFILLAYIFQMNTILWLVRNGLGVVLMMLIVIFQPELRRALDVLGRKSFVAQIMKINVGGSSGERFSDKTRNELIRASFEMGRARTGALIVIEQVEPLEEYIRTGIALDSIVSSQLLINIFEHNTPLHDGAVIIRGDRIISATCYLPLSENMALSKELGTRHRAGVGISEMTDSLTIIVSEETGRISVAYEGELFRNVDLDFLTEKLTLLQNKNADARKFRLWKGREKK
ncbi:MAG: diadenylate cyclase CdaA [Lachnospiraceae bacterium]|nr:diadenylate cyclase CdaA [Lachnospiraceae bacterium]